MQKGKEFNGNKIIIMACSDCNTHCKHCYISYKGNFDSENLYEICKELSNKYTVRLNGTELIIHPDYFKSLKLIKQELLLTNGIEIQRKPEIVKELAAVGIKRVRMSYHFGIHESISSVSQKIVEENIPKLAKEGIITELRVTITRNNLELIPDMCKKTIELGAKRIKFTNYMCMGSAEQLSHDNILTKKDLERFFEILEQERNKYPEVVLKIRRCGTFGKDYSGRKCNFSCPAIEDCVVMTPDYNIYPCVFLAKPGYEIGKFENGKIIIYKDIESDNQKCLAKEINNNGLKIFDIS